MNLSIHSCIISDDSLAHVFLLDIFRAVATEMAVYHQITYNEVLEEGRVPLWPEDKIAHPFKYTKFHVDIYPLGYEDQEKNKR